MQSRDLTATALAWAANTRRDQTKALTWALVRQLTRSTDGPVMTMTGPSGLHRLVETFARHGLGDIMASWVASGPNLPITVVQLRTALADDLLDSLAEPSGLPRDVALERLIRILPVVVDRLTPNGAIPERGLAEQGLDLLETLAS